MVGLGWVGGRGLGWTPDGGEGGGGETGGQ